MINSIKPFAVQFYLIFTFKKGRAEDGPIAQPTHGH